MKSFCQKLFILVFAVSIIPVWSHAQIVVTSQSSNLTPLYPQLGMYYDRTQSGSGLTLDRGLNGAMFVALYTYDTEHNPTFYTLQGNFIPTSESERFATGVLGKLQSPVIKTSGGQCIGCPYVAPTVSVVDELGVAEITWSARRAVVKIGSQTWTMDATDFDRHESDLMKGTWLMALSFDPGDSEYGIAVYTAVVRLSPAPPYTNLGFTHEVPGIHMPPEGSQFYEMYCEAAGTLGTAPCQDLLARLDFNDGISGFKNNKLFWYDPVTKRAGLDLYHFASGYRIIGTTNIHFELFLSSDKITGHGVSQGARPPNASVWHDGEVAFTLTMVRLPDGFKGSCLSQCRSN